jgi:hypothetical protein
MNIPRDALVGKFLTAHPVIPVSGHNKNNRNSFKSGEWIANYTET